MTVLTVQQRRRAEQRHQEAKVILHGIWVTFVVFCLFVWASGVLR